MKKIFFLALLYIVIINCSKSDDFMGSTPNGYKTFENPLIGYEMSIPSDITISTRSYPIEGNQENLIVNFSEPKDPYSANQEIMIFSSEISKRGIIDIVFTSTNPLFVNLIFGITDKGKRLKPI